jgi:hypothetical protein
MPFSQETGLTEIASTIFSIVKKEEKQAQRYTGLKRSKTMPFNLPFNLPGQQKDGLSASDIIEITDKGRQAVEHQTYRGDKYEILLRLDVLASNMKDLTRYTGIPLDRVRNAVMSLCNRQEVEILTRRF